MAASHEGLYYLCVHFIERLVVCLLGKVDVGSEHFIKRRSRRFQYRRKIREHLLCLANNLRRHEFPTDVATDLASCVDYSIVDFGMIYARATSV